MHKCAAQALSWGSTALLLTMAVSACGQDHPPAKDAPSDASPLEKSDIPWSGGPSPYDAVVKLDDGRRVAMHYRRGKGLVEQHYSPQARAWSKPALIYRTKTDACQGIGLRARGETVAAIADFGTYCYDGEPPTESIAAVGTDGLTKWDTNITKDFDGWERAAISKDGQQVTFERDVTLHWNRDEGFDEAQEGHGSGG